MMRTAVLLAALAAPLAANDIVYLHGKVQLADGSKPGRSAIIQLSCKGSDPVRLTNSGKNGSYFIKVARQKKSWVHPGSGSLPSE
jgi:hypothetical protein